MRIVTFFLVSIAPLFSACGEQALAEREAQTASATSVVTRYDGPFGLKMGLTAKDLEHLGLQKLSAPNAYVASIVPNPLSGIEMYFLEIGSNNGLCVITAVYEEFEVNSFGDQLKSKYDDLKSALAEKYGTPSSVVNFVRTGSLFQNPEHFMLGIRAEERALSSSWRNNALPHQLGEISIQAASRESDSGYIILRYAFLNEAVCEKEKSQAATSTL